MGGLDFANGQLEAFELLPHFLEREAKVVADDGGCRGEPEQGFAVALQTLGHLGEVGEKRGDEFVELLARRGESEGSALEKHRAEILLQFDQLRAHRWLLDAVGHVADGEADAAMGGDVVEELQVMDVHSGSLHQH